MVEIVFGEKCFDENAGTRAWDYSVYDSGNENGDDNGNDTGDAIENELLVGMRVGMIICPRESWW